MNKSDVVEDLDAVRSTNPLDTLIVKMHIPRAQNIGLARDSRLQYKIVIRVVNDGRKTLWHIDNGARVLQKTHILRDHVSR